MIPVVAAYIERDGKVLLVKRPQHKKRGGLWEFPGGKMEKGETPEEALARELREELGIEISGVTLLAKIRYPYPDGEIELILFRADFHGELTPTEAEEIAWISKEAIGSLNLCPADRELLTVLP